MAKLVITAAFLTLATVDYTDEISECTLDLEVDQQDVTNMDSAGWTELIGGIKSGTLNINFKKDADLSGLDSAIFAALGTVIAFAIRQADTAIATTNPEYQGSVLISQWQPVAGAVGQVFEGSVGWPTSGAVVRDVTP